MEEESAKNSKQNALYIYRLCAAIYTFILTKLKTHKGNTRTVQVDSNQGEETYAPYHQAG